jgi:hypothetical protein
MSAAASEKGTRYRRTLEELPLAQRMQRICSAQHRLTIPHRLYFFSKDCGIG